MSESSFSLPAFDEDSRPPLDLVSRRLVYLDSNAWIELADHKQDAAAAECVRAVEKGELLFPLSYPIISEVIEQPNIDQRRTTAALMDRLSMGVTFRPVRTIQLLEAERAFAILLGQTAVPPEPGLILSWAIEFVGTANVTFDATWDEAKAKRFLDLMRQERAVRSVGWIVDHAPVDAMRARHAESKARYVEELSASIHRAAAAVAQLAGPARKRRLVLEERKYVTETILVPRFRDLLIERVGVEGLREAVSALSSQLGEGDERRFEQLMQAAPSTDLWCEIMAERSMNSSRRVRPQDFHDVEHGLVGGAYSDVFVTRDSGLIDLLEQRCTVPKRFGVRVLRGVDALGAELAAG